MIPKAAQMAVRMALLPVPLRPIMKFARNDTSAVKFRATQNFRPHWPHAPATAVSLTLSLCLGLLLHGISSGLLHSLSCSSHFDRPHLRRTPLDSQLCPPTTERSPSSSPISPLPSASSTLPTQNLTLALAPLACSVLSRSTSAAYLGLLNSSHLHARPWPHSPYQYKVRLKIK